jgi:hypothetical protein
LNPAERFNDELGGFAATEVPDERDPSVTAVVAVSLVAGLTCTLASAATALGALTEVIGADPEWKKRWDLGK